MEWDCESLAMSSSKQECVNSAEPLVGLKLGKRTYFQNSNVHSSSSNGPASPAPIPKRGKPSSKGSEISRCQVDGCNLDLSSAKKYHQKHRVCDSHSKCPNVIVGGVERRFCQQCSRFHGLSEFDEKKRSCRRRLSDHNARRRNPRRQSIHFNSSFYEFADDRKQMSFVLNKGQLVPSRTAENSSWDSETSKFTNHEELTSNPGKTTTIMRQSSGFPLPNAASNAWDWPLAYDGTTAEAFNQGAKGSMFPSNVGTIPEFCALSLLSSPSPGSFEPKLISSGGNNVHENQSSIPELMLHEVPQIMPLASTEYWQWQSSADFHGHSLVPNTNNGDLFPEIQLFKAPCDTDFYFTAFK